MASTLLIGAVVLTMNDEGVFTPNEAEGAEDWAEIVNATAANVQIPTDDPQPYETLLNAIVAIIPGMTAGDVDIVDTRADLIY